MYKQGERLRTTLKVDKSYEGETMEEKLRRIKNNREPLSDGITPLIYTNRADGVMPEYDIRADKFELMIESAEKNYETHATNKKAFEEKLEAENKAAREKAEGKPAGGEGQGT